MNIFSTLSKCFKISFEVLAVIACLTALLLLYRTWQKKGIRKDRSLLMLLLFFLPAAFFWRSLVELVSSRYASFFIFPALALGAYGAYMIPGFLFKLLKKHKKKIPAISSLTFSGSCRLAGRAVILFLLIFFIGKMLRYNKYSDFYEKSGAIIRKEVKKDRSNAICLDFCGDHRRINFYSGLFCIPYPNLGVMQMKEAAFLQDHLPVGFDAVYIYCNFREETPLPPSFLGLQKKEWQRVFVSPRNNRKKSYVHVYRFRPERKE